MEIQSDLVIPCVSLIQILHDLTERVTISGVKLAKCLGRLRTVCVILGINPDIYIGQLRLARAVTTNVTDDELFEYLNQETEEIYDRVILGENYDDRVKKALEAELTTKLNSDLTIYKIICNYTCRLIKRLANHSILGPLYKSRDIIFVHKGGIAQRLSLIQAFPEHRDLIEQSFKLGGDNDCSVMINPNLEQYDEVRDLLIDWIYHYMIENASRFAIGSVANKAKNVKSITINGTEFTVAPSLHQNFHIINENNVSQIIYTVNRNSVFISRNDNLSFRDETGRPVCFTL